MGPYEDVFVSGSDAEDHLLAAEPTVSMTELSPLTGHVVAARIDEAGLLAARSRGYGAGIGPDPVDALADVAIASLRDGQVSRQSA